MAKLLVFAAFKKISKGPKMASCAERTRIGDRKGEMERVTCNRLTDRRYAREDDFVLSALPTRREPQAP
jgi:hypothetical protein